jgi:hypothetical protein
MSQPISFNGSSGRSEAAEQPEFAELLHAVGLEPVPEKLLVLARQLAAALDGRPQVAERIIDVDGEPVAVS